MAILIVAQWDASGLKENLFNVISAAHQINKEVDVLVLGDPEAKGFKEALSSLEARGSCNKLIVGKSSALQYLLAESAAPIISAIGKSYSHILTANSSWGKDVMPRAAALAGTVMISDIIAIKSPAEFQRYTYAGNVVETVNVDSSTPVFMTVRTSQFPLLSAADKKVAMEELSPDVLAAAIQTLSSFVSQELSKADRPELPAARVVVSGGRGLKSKENFKMIEELADLLQGAVGASRAVVDAGMVPNELQVGQTGQVVAPELYIAIGISGAIQHVAGMKDSKIIVAINKDAQAPIFEIADYGLVGDLFKIVPELTEKLRAHIN